MTFDLCVALHRLEPIANLYHIMPPAYRDPTHYAHLVLAARRAREAGATLRQITNAAHMTGEPQ